MKPLFDAVLDAQCDKVQEAQPGSRNNVLYESAFIVFSHAVPSVSDLNRAKTLLLSAALIAGLHEQEAMFILNQALDRTVFEDKLAKPRVSDMSDGRPCGACGMPHSHEVHSGFWGEFHQYDWVSKEIRALVERGNITVEENESLSCNSYEREAMVPALTDEAFLKQMQHCMGQCERWERPSCTYDKAVIALYAPDLVRRFAQLKLVNEMIKQPPVYEGALTEKLFPIEIYGITSLRKTANQMTASLTDKEQELLRKRFKTTVSPLNKRVNSLSDIDKEILSDRFDTDPNHWTPEQLTRSELIREFKLLSNRLNDLIDAVIADDVQDKPDVAEALDKIPKRKKFIYNLDLGSDE